MRKYSLSIFFISFIFFWIPPYLQFRNLDFAWHDQGHLFTIITNLFRKGYFYSPDWQIDHFNVHFTPIFYLIAPILHLSENLLWF